MYGIVILPKTGRHTGLGSADRYMTLPNSVIVGMVRNQVSTQPTACQFIYSDVYE